MVNNATIVKENRTLNLNIFQKFQVMIIFIFEKITFRTNFFEQLLGESDICRSSASSF
jgi:hypothetical protein